MPKLGHWLASLGLSEYTNRFAQSYVDTTILRDLTDKDLKALGIPPEDRTKLLAAIAELERPHSQPSFGPIQDGSQDSAERRQLTVLICDLVGSTALSTSLDPEDLRDVMRAYQNTCANIISSYDGFVCRFMGDAILVYFGYPRAHEDDAERAIRAGLEIVAAVEQMEPAANQLLTVRIGIATGVVVVGDLIRGGGAEEQVVVGDTPNLASRLQALAKPGTVLIAGNTRRLTAGHFLYHDLGSVSLKGLLTPIHAWQVLRASEIPSRFEAEHGTSLPPLLGRDEEIELLLRRSRAATQGQGRVVVLNGEPGIGKSHIALALRERLQGQDYTFLSYFCSSHHTHSAFFPFTQQLERAARFHRNETAAKKLEKLRTLLAKSSRDLDHDVSILANLLSLTAAEQESPERKPQKRKDSILWALLDQLEGLAVSRPVLIIFEDVHWADPTSLELLALTVPRVAKLRVLLIMTARPEFVPLWPSHAHVTTIALTRLNRRDGAALMARVTMGKKLPEDVEDEILARTDGVPLFLEELTKAVLESGLLQERAGRYVLDRPRPLSIPTTLHASLMARLDRLGSAKEMAQTGAALGREFSYELLSIVAGIPKEKLDRAVAQLVRSELVFCRGELPHTVYSFKHALVRDVAYAGLLRSRRIQLHAAITETLEQRFPEVVETEPETLAHHLEEAGDIRRAIELWLRAGKRAAARSTNVEAIAHLQRGLQAISHAPEGFRQRLELDFQLSLGPCWIATQGPASTPAVETFTRARQLCEELGEPPEYLQVMFWLTTASVVRGELSKAAEEIGTLLRLAEARNDRPALLNALRGRAMILLFSGQVLDAHKAIEHAVQMFSSSNESDRLAARAAGQDPGAAGFALMSWTLWILGRVDEATVRIAAALDRAEAVRHPHSQAYVCYYAAILYCLRDEPALAHDYAKRCFALSEQHKFRQWHSLSRAVRGISMAMLDPSSSGSLDDIREALDDYRTAGYQLGITALDVLFCRILLFRHQFDAAFEVIDHGLSTISLNNERIFEAELYRLRARSVLMRGGEEAETDAECLFRQAITTARDQSARSLQLRAAMDLSALWLTHGRHDDAVHLLRPIYSTFKEGFDTQDLKESKALLDQLTVC